MIAVVTDVQGRSRATALPIEERRSAIIAATLPLFLEQGANVTTREIAQAAEIAEGTIFRVFADKTELLDAVLDAALDIAPADAFVAGIDPTLAFRERLVAVVDMLRKRVLYLFKVYSVASETNTKTTRRDSSDLPALVALFAAEADHLSCSPKAAARILRGLTVACVHPSFGTTEPLTSEEIVSTLLDGIHRPEGGEPC
jgi:AcrR family transcriptional regulator